MRCCLCAVKKINFTSLTHLLRPTNSLSKGLRLLGVASLCASLVLPTTAQAMGSFNAAKRVLPKIYYQLDKEFKNTSTIYCGCDLNYSGNPKKPRWSLDLDSCGYEVRKNANRAQRIEVEHVMPAWEFGHQLQCWQNGGRKACGKVAQFKVMEGDLHNLFPSVGEINGDRGNFQFTDWNGKPAKYGRCQMVIDFKLKQAQPPKASRGQIARAYLYMAETYNIRLSNQQRRLYEAWNRMYPADQVECRRNELIAKEQGNLNRFVTESCKLAAK